MTVQIRQMTVADLASGVSLINHIIALGGSTAYETPFDETTFRAEFLDDPEIALVAETAGRVGGFQVAYRGDDGTYYIGTFADQRRPLRGVGSALMAETVALCRAAGGTSIVAKITSDNTAGLTFYSKMGFADETVLHRELTRRDGTTVDRVVKRLTL